MQNHKVLLVSIWIVIELSLSRTAFPGIGGHRSVAGGDAIRVQSAFLHNSFSGGRFYAPILPTSAISGEYALSAGKRLVFWILVGSDSNLAGGIPGASGFFQRARGRGGLFADGVLSHGAKAKIMAVAGVAGYRIGPCGHWRSPVYPAGAFPDIQLHSAGRLWRASERLL